jgi:hypothetical protein
MTITEREHRTIKSRDHTQSPLNFTMEQAREMRERGLAKIVEQAMTELLKEEWWGESPE